MAELLGTGAGEHHGADGLGIERADVDVERAADGGDVLHVVGLVAHDGRAAARDDDVGHIVDGHVVRDVVNQGYGRANCFESLCEHGHATPFCSCRITGTVVSVAGALRPASQPPVAAPVV